MTSRIRTSKNPFFVSLVAAVAAALFFGALFADVKAKNERASFLINEIEAQAARESAIAAAQVLIEATKAERGKLKTYFLSRDRVVSFIEMLESLGRDAGVTLTIGSVEPLAEKAEKGDGGYLRLALRFEGGWQNAIRFIGLLELLPLEADVQGVRLFRLPDNERGRWGSDVVLRVLQKG